MTNMRYQQALDYIYGFLDLEKSPRPRDPVNYDLRRMVELLERLGSPHLAARTVHITGTKGKGSVATMVASVLTSSGYSTGLYTSPHLITFNERIQIDGKLITDEDVAALIDKLKPEVAEVNRKATYGLLTTFEVMTALGFMWFAQQGVDFQVIEVGLGGRLDATNIVKPEVCVITSISYDHTEVLGKTLTLIATEKAGIIKPGCVVVAAPFGDEAGKVITGACRDKGVELIRVGREITAKSTGSDYRGQSIQVKGRLGSYDLRIPLLGQHQVENAAAAVAVLEVLKEKGTGISSESLTSGLARVNWPGRLQVLHRKPLVVADGAHNQDSARRLREALRDYFKFRRAILIIGMSFDKDADGIIAELAPAFDEVIATHSTHPRAMATGIIASKFFAHGVKELSETDDVSDALRLAIGMAGEDDMVCVTGSLFVVGGALEQARLIFPSGSGK